MRGHEELLEGWRMAGRCEREDGGNIRTPMAHDDSDELTIHIINGRREDASIAPKNQAI